MLDELAQCSNCNEHH